MSEEIVNANITKEEFSKIYQESFVPNLKNLEQERLELMSKIKPFGIVTLIAVIISVIGFFIKNGYCMGIGYIVTFPCVIYITLLYSKIRKKLKKEVVSKILSIYGNLYFSESKDVISYKDIRSMGLFPSFTEKSDDDIVIGLYKGCNFVINECKLRHTERYGKNSTTVTDFSGLLIKIQINKNFSGKTIVGNKWHITKLNGFADVVLEDVEFMKSRKVYSTDQIEARYILTTSFMERLKMLGATFAYDRSTKQIPSSTQGFQEQSLIQNLHSAAESIKNADFNIRSMAIPYLNYGAGVSAAFTDGYVYLFVPSREDFFEIDINTTLYDENKYYNIYVEIQSILSIIDYLKLNLKLGM